MPADKACCLPSEPVIPAGSGHRPLIPDKEGRKAHSKAKGTRGGRPPVFDSAAHEGRNVIGRLHTYKHNPRVGTRHDKLTVRFWAVIQVAGGNRWLT
ncbi:putative transposase [Corynebacterium halotolerans YIM 70093 = DSM 44683]|uniref:Putative transposase n=1 Tax=Corynebacterium halotolerans YIM 70093 = DSM 44683 TaxID=1121362 RepID=M1NVB9_9CORY|nr:putative transposase [Corynebacterium halotolerans YIM 70093 = DSM 44683]